MLLNNALDGSSGLCRGQASAGSNVVRIDRYQSQRTMRAGNIENGMLRFIDGRRHLNLLRMPSKRWAGFIAARTRFAMLLRIAIRIAERRRRRRAFLELYALDDRTLNDIGISRCEIHDRVYGRRLR